MDIDEIFIRTGEFGWFQKKAFLGVCLTTFYCGVQMVQNIFSGAKPEPKDMLCSSNVTLDACDPRCSSILYLDNFTSYATEWQMVCGADASRADNTQSIFMFGVMVGSFFMGGLGDRFGRFPVLSASQIFSSVFAFISSFANVWSLYAVLRFLTGFFVSGIIIVGFVLTSELVGPSKRNIVGTIPALTFALGICALSGTAWIVQNWRTLSAIMGVLGIFCCPPIFFLYEESPRWHLGKGDVEGCKKILDKIAKINGHNLGNYTLKSSTVTSGNSSKKLVSPGMLDLFKNRILRKITVIQMFSWFTVSAVYYGLTLAAGHLGESRYISVMLSAFVEIPSNLIIIYFMNHPKCGRVKSCAISMIIASVSCAAIWFVSDQYSAAIIALSCGGKFFMVMSFAIVYVQAAELFPTSVRNVGIGLVSVFNRIGGVVAPVIVSLDHWSHNSQFMVFGVLGFICGFVCFLLPETLNRPLPETPEDIYAQTKKLDKQVVKLSQTSTNSTQDRQRLLSNMDDSEEEETDLSHI